MGLRELIGRDGGWRLTPPGTRLWGAPMRLKSFHESFHLIARIFRKYLNYIDISTDNRFTNRFMPFVTQVDGVSGALVDSPWQYCI